MEYGVFSELFEVRYGVMDSWWRVKGTPCVMPVSPCIASPRSNNLNKPSHDYKWT